MIDSKTLAQTLVKLSKGKDSEKSVKAFFEYLEKKNFLGLLPQVKKHLERSLQDSSQAETVVISSKHELSSPEIKEIISMIGADSNVATEMIIDESIVGGFSVVYQRNIYDGSLRNQITQLGIKLRS